MVNEIFRLKEAEGLHQEQGPLGNNITKTVDNIVDASIPTQNEVSTMRRLFARMSEVMANIFEGCQVRRCGSSGTAFDIKASNLDVVILTADYMRTSAQNQPAPVSPQHVNTPATAPDTENTPSAHLRNTEKIRECMRTLAARLEQQYNNEFAIVLMVESEHVQVPVLKLKHKPTGIDVDVTVSRAKVLIRIRLAHTHTHTHPPIL